VNNGDRIGRQIEEKERTEKGGVVKKHGKWYRE
jgi:hypothetical protein